MRAAILTGVVAFMFIHPHMMLGRAAGTGASGGRR